MEIEAKYIVPNLRVARQLQALDHVGEYSLSAPTRHMVRDTFFDTPEGDLAGTHHVLRFRRRDDGHALLTFKAPAQKDAAIHRRPETELEITLERTPRVLKVNTFPAQIRKLVQPLVTADALHAIFSIEQTREVKVVRRERRIIGEWSLDHVRFRAGERKKAFYELEIELKRAGREDELIAIAEWLVRKYGLEPQGESKFARGLQFLRGE